VYDLAVERKRQLAAITEDGYQMPTSYDEPEKRNTRWVIAVCCTKHKTKRACQLGRNAIYVEVQHIKRRMWRIIFAVLLYVSPGEYALRNVHGLNTAKKQLAWLQGA
jgi:hypothetical protein